MKEQEHSRLQITQISVRDTMGDDDYATFVEGVHECIGPMCAWDDEGQDAAPLKEELEVIIKNCPRCNKEENGEGALTIEIDDKPYNICRTHFEGILGYWPFAQAVMGTFNEADLFYKLKFRGLAHPMIEQKQVLVKSQLTKFKKDESSGSAWRYYNDKVIKALGGRWIPSQNGWLFHEDQEWVDGGWRMNGERAEGEWRLRKRY